MMGTAFSVGKPELAERHNIESTCQERTASWEGYNMKKMSGNTPESTGFA